MSKYVDVYLYIDYLTELKQSAGTLPTMRRKNG